MRIRLLNRGGYAGFEGVNFPVEVEARKVRPYVYAVHERELKRIGCDMALLADPYNPEWYFSLHDGEVAE